MRKPDASRAQTLYGQAFLCRFRTRIMSTRTPHRSTLSTSRPAAADHRSGRAEDARVTVVLGPTNTGKTHLALERMTGYATGMIGFPLRLLARENYDRLVARHGAGKVGLITGEERILPPGAR